MIEQTLDYEPYILNDNNMMTYLKYKIINKPNKNIEINKNTEISNGIGFKNKESSLVKTPLGKNQNQQQTLFIPKEEDTLFWCYYIISSGESSYEMMNVKNSLIAKQLKINYVDKIRTNKQIVKIYKFDTITNIESNLANDNIINIKSVMTLCAVDKINIIFIKKNTYYELLMNDTDPIYIIRETEYKSKYCKKYGFEIANPDILEEIRTTLYKVETLNKPIKALSSYKVQELLDICNKLAIEVKHTDTGKNKSKNELYESLMQYF
jgi:hypothetical protein